jgi:hypothetical protein
MSNLHKCPTGIAVLPNGKTPKPGLVLLYPVDSRCFGKNSYLLLPLGTGSLQARQDAKGYFCRNSDKNKEPLFAQGPLKDEE